MTGRCLQGHSRTTQAPLTVFHYVRLLIWAVTRLRITSENGLTVNSMCQSSSTDPSPLKCHFLFSTIPLYHFFSLSLAHSSADSFSHRGFVTQKMLNSNELVLLLLAVLHQLSLSFFPNHRADWGFQNNSWMEVTAGRAAVYWERLKREYIRIVHHIFDICCCLHQQCKIV